MFAIFVMVFFYAILAVYCCDGDDVLTARGG